MHIRMIIYETYDEAKAAFLSAYGEYNEREVLVDGVASVLSALLIACSRKVFPDWAKGLLERVKDGRLLAAVERLLMLNMEGKNAL